MFEAALSDVSGLTASLHGGSHVGRHLRRDKPTGSHDPGVPVRTATLDDLLGSILPGDGQPVVLKLDVEGQEVQALMGAVELLRRDILIVYEDHGRDTSHTTTAYARSELGLSVGWLLPSGGVRPVGSLSDLDRIKTNRRYGYNFVAYRKDSIFPPYLHSRSD